MGSERCQCTVSRETGEVPPSTDMNGSAFTRTSPSERGGAGPEQGEPNGCLKHRNRLNASAAAGFQMRIQRRFVHRSSSEATAHANRGSIAKRFAFPLAVNGHIYLGAQGEVDVYGLLK